MSTSVDDAVRALLLLMPRMVGRAKRIPVPAALQSLALAPRHLSLLSYLLFDGPLTVNDLAARLEVAPTTVSLMVGELSGKGILERREDPADRRAASSASPMPNGLPSPRGWRAEPPPGVRRWNR